MKRTKYIFKIYYIGSEKYYGSQRQNEFFTIEDSIIDILTKGDISRILKTQGLNLRVEQID